MERNEYEMNSSPTPRLREQEDLKFSLFLCTGAVLLCHRDDLIFLMMTICNRDIGRIS